MIVHAVFCAIRPEISADAIARVLRALDALKEQCAGLVSLESGLNIDLEQKSQGYSHGFLMRFETRDALEAYAVHRAHIAVAGELVALCVGGAEGIMVFDLDI